MYLLCVCHNPFHTFLQNFTPFLNQQFDDPVYLCNFVCVFPTRPPGALFGGDVITSERKHWEGIFSFMYSKTFETGQYKVRIPLAFEQVVA